jgi:hypothetical protein
MKKPWNITCPSCQNKNAYQGFLTCECPNYSCRYYSETQKDLNKQYQNYLDSLEEELLDTVPHKDNSGYYVSNTYVSAEDDKEDQTPTVPYGTTYASGYDPNDPYDPYDSSGYYSNQNQSLNNDPVSDDDLTDLFGTV